MTARTLRTAGLVACLIGVLAMLSGRFVAGVPAWLSWVGVGVIVFGWGLFGWSIVANLRSRIR